MQYFILRIVEKVKRSGSRSRCETLTGDEVVVVVLVVVVVVVVVVVSASWRSDALLLLSPKLSAIKGKC